MHSDPTLVCTEVWFDKTPIDQVRNLHPWTPFPKLSPICQCYLQLRRTCKWLATAWVRQQNQLVDANICNTLQKVRIMRSHFELWGHLWGKAVSGSHPKSRIAFTRSGEASLRQTVAEFLNTGQQNDGRHEYTKSEPFNVAGYALTIPLNESYTIWTRNSFPPEDFETTMWSMATCSPNLERCGKSDSGPGTRWLRILFEQSLARLQMSHKGCFGKWLIRCSIETASALARTTASESIGRGSSGATSLTSAALDERSPKSPGSTAGSTDESGTTGSSRSSGGVSTRKSSAGCSTAAGTPGITSKLDWKKGTFWEILDA